MSPRGRVVPIRTALLGPALALLLLAKGCSPQADFDGDFGVIDDDPVVLVHRLDGQMDFDIVAELAYDEDSGCLRLESPSNQTNVPVWPEGTEPAQEDGRRGVNVPEVGTFMEGDEVDAGGGGVGTFFAEADLDLPAGCVPPGGPTGITNF